MIRADVESLPFILPTLTAQARRFFTVVPHVPEPTLPVLTLNLVSGRRPFAVIVTATTVEMLHWA